METSFIADAISHFGATMTLERAEELRILSQEQKWEALAGAMMKESEKLIKALMGGGDPKKEEKLLNMYRDTIDLGAYAWLLKSQHEAKQKRKEFDILSEYRSIVRGGARRILEQKMPVIRNAFVENGFLLPFYPGKQEG